LKKLLSLGLLLSCLHLGAVAEPVRPVHALLDQAYDELLERSPVEQTRQGLKRNLDHWDSLGPQEARERLAVLQRWSERLPASTDRQEALSIRLFRYQLEQERRALPFAEYDYPINQMHGWHSEIPAFLSNAQPLGNMEEAEAYLARLRALPEFFEQLGQALKRRQQAGILPPRFVFDYCLSDIDHLLQGYPLTASPEQPHPLYQDFRSKLERTSLGAEQRQQLMDQLEQALSQDFARAYRELRQLLAEQREQASDDDGVWKFPRGAEFYNLQLQQITTTELSAEQIHQLGLREVERIQKEMRQMKERVEFNGSLVEFFEHLRSHPRYFYPNTPEGRAAYLRDATAVVDAIRPRLKDWFITLPRAPLVVKAVESYREQSAGKAFYEAPALDGSRPGHYYANLYDMNSMPRYQMEALAYHEAIPGHHMQISLAQELPDLPKFRRLSGFTAYVEGWGLYCEQLPKEHGFYQDVYSDFGRLNLELFRAARLVVDTGIHQLRWTRAQALDYYLKNTPNSRRDCQKMVDRHIVMPGQATAYKVGMLEILRLRERAREQLGERFDLREFHEVVLTHGAVPLKILEELVEEYITRNRRP